MMHRRAWARLAAAVSLLACTAIGSALPLLTLAPIARAQDEPAVPAYQGYVTDAAGVLSDDTRAKLEAFLDQVQKKTGAQFAVLTMASTAPAEPSDYKTRVFGTWKIGKQGNDNGLLLLIAMKEHKIYFETGYGLEGTLPDGLEARIVRERMVPLMRGGDVDGAVVAGVQAAALRIAADQHVTLTWDGRELRYGGDSAPGRFPVGLIVFVIFIIITSILRASGGRRRGGWWWLGPG
ncbi:MAG: TPM domain-containing protein, partial [Candidatus Eiseniibacteriota bacterium]